MSDKLRYCSFCAKDEHEVFLLVAGPVVFICDECIDICRDVLRAKRLAKIEKLRELEARHDLA